jgi:hypothetical protein
MKRMPKDAGKVHPYVGRAETTVDQIVKDLDPKGLHFAFLDPYKFRVPLLGVSTGGARVSRRR